MLKLFALCIVSDSAFFEVLDSASVVKIWPKNLENLMNLFWFWNGEQWNQIVWFDFTILIKYEYFTNHVHVGAGLSSIQVCKMFLILIFILSTYFKGQLSTIIKAIKNIFSILIPFVTAIDTTGTVGRLWEESTVNKGNAVVAVVEGRAIWWEKLWSPKGAPKWRINGIC